MKIDIKRINSLDKSILLNLFQLYMHDITKSLHMDINKHGLFEYNEIDLYFLGDKDREAYFIMADNNIAGFILIDKEFLVLEKAENTYNISEFFILNGYKRKGIGKIVAKKIFDEHKGKFEVRPIPKSQEAYDFWINVIKEYTNDNYEVHELKNDSRNPITFES